MKFLNLFKKIKKDDIIRNSFLLPILLVVLISINHTVTWYDIGNPLMWAIYLSVAIEVFALSSISAASINISKGSIWFLFGLVTSIQMIGNVFFSFTDIDPTGPLFKSWIELIQPVFPDWDSLDHRRFLALIQGGSLPIMSLTALHFYLKFHEKKLETIVTPVNVNEPVIDPVNEPVIEPVKQNKIDPADPKNKFWKGLVKQPTPVSTPVSTPPTKNDDEDMAKFNPQE